MPQRRVICAAWKATDGTVFCGARHVHCAELIIDTAGDSLTLSLESDAQGFVDQDNVFMTRKEAWLVAKAAGQIGELCETPDRPDGALISKEIY